MKTKLISSALLFSAVLFSCNNRQASSQDLSASPGTIDSKSYKSANGNSTNLKNDETFAITERTVADENGVKTNGSDRDKIPVGNQQPPSLDTVATPIPSPIKSVGKVDWDKKIIKTATMKLEVKNFKGYNETVHKTVKQFGGYIAQEENNLSDEKSETIISIKVPVDQFEDMMNQLPGGDVKVLERKITTEDVTGEIVDTRSRLEAKKQMRLKYLEFLKQSKNMEEVLQVQGEINSIQEEIEAAAGRVEFLSHQSVFSTINLTFFEPLPGYKPDNDAPSFVSKVSAAFKSGGKWCAELFVGLISIWPLLLLVIGGIVVLKRYRSNKIAQPVAAVKNLDTLA